MKMIKRTNRKTQKAGRVSQPQPQPHSRKVRNPSQTRKLAAKDSIISYKEKQERKKEKERKEKERKTQYQMIGSKIDEIIHKFYCSRIFYELQRNETFLNETIQTLKSLEDILNQLQLKNHSEFPLDCLMPTYFETKEQGESYQLIFNENKIEGCNKILKEEHMITSMEKKKWNCHQAYLEIIKYLKKYFEVILSVYHEETINKQPTIPISKKSVGIPRNIPKGNNSIPSKELENLLKKPSKSNSNSIIPKQN